MNKRAVIFDFNGTMLFDTKFQMDAWNAVLEECGRPLMDEETFRDVLCGRSSQAMIDYLWGGGMSEQRVRLYCNRKKKAYQQLCLDDPVHFQLAPGLEVYLDELKEMGIPFTIATSSSAYSVDFYFKYLELGRWFRRDDIICKAQIEHGKPDPELFLKAAEMLKTPPEDCLVFEDANAGVEAANRAGIGAVVVIDPENRFFPEEHLKFDAVYPDFRAVFPENTVAVPEGRKKREK